MDFLISRGFELQPVHDRLVHCRLSTLDVVEVQRLAGPVQYMFSGTRAALTQDEQTRTLRFFDGQASLGDEFFHASFVARSSAGLVRQALCFNEQLSAGVFCAGELSDHDGAVEFTVTTDWAAQYPLLLWRSGDRFVLSNNLAMMEVLTAEARSVVAAVLNLVCVGGRWHGTQLEGVQRLDLGSYVRYNPGQGWRLLARPDHAPDQLDYDEAIERARSEILRHTRAAIQSVKNPVVVSDLTGGGDSRAVFGLMREAAPAGFSVRTMGVYPSPDANVGSLIAELYSAPSCTYPVPQVSPQLGLRQNAYLSAGARESGAFVSPVAFENLVHFKGIFGEMGGANAGIDYIGEALRSGGTFSFRAALAILVKRQRTVGNLRYLTPQAIELALDEEVANFEELSGQGLALEHLFAERYIRIKCRSHFGLFSFISNKNHVSPDPLCNRWLVAARRKLPVSLYRKNKVIYDLVKSLDEGRLSFLPMANGKWAREVVGEADISNWEAMRVVGFGDPNLSARSGQLFQRSPIEVPIAWQCKMLPLKAVVSHQAVVPQAAHLGVTQAMIDYLLQVLAPNDSVWDYFSRDGLLEFLALEPTQLRQDGLDVNAAGIVCAALLWKAGLDIRPSVREVRALSPAP